MELCVTNTFGFAKDLRRLRFQAVASILMHFDVRAIDDLVAEDRISFS